MTTLLYIANKNCERSPVTATASSDPRERSRRRTAAAATTTSTTNWRRNGGDDEATMVLYASRASKFRVSKTAARSDIFRGRTSLASDRHVTIVAASSAISSANVDACCPASADRQGWAIETSLLRRRYDRPAVDERAFCRRRRTAGRPAVGRQPPTATGLRALANAGSTCSPYVQSNEWIQKKLIYSDARLYLYEYSLVHRHNQCVDEMRIGNNAQIL